MAALTRILNNQIYNSTIIGYQKIAAGTITGSLFASNVTVPGDLLIAGNLFVLGSSSYTTIASTNTYVNDPLVVMNNGFSGTNTYDEGLIFNRGTSQNQAIIWSEAFSEFRLISTAETGTTYGNINAIGLARLSIGSLNVPGQANIGILVTSGAITGSSLNVSGNVLASTSIAQLHTGSTATFGNVAAVTVGNVGTQFNGAAINLSGNVLATAGIFNALTVNGNETVTGYLNVTGNVMAAVITASQLNTTGNVLATAGTFNALTVNGNETVTGYLNVTGNILASQGRLNYLDVNGNVDLGLVGAVAGSWVNVIGNITQTSSGGAVYFNTTGNISAAVGQFGSINSTGYINTSGNISTPQLNAGQINTTGNVLATGGVYNLLTVNGNIATTGQFATTRAGNAGDAGGQIFLNGATSNRIDWAAVGTGAPAFTTRSDGTKLVLYPSLSGSVTDYALGIAAATLWTSVPEAADGFNFKWYGATTLAANLSGSGNFTTAGAVVVNSTTPSSSTATGALIVKGGAGVAGNLYVGAGLNVTGNETISGYLNVTGNVMAAVVTASQINTTGNVLATAGVFNALTVNGNGSVTGYLNVTGNIIAATAEVGSVEAAGVIYANSSAATTTQGTGALIIPTGGISVAGAANIAGTATIGGAVQLNNTLSVGGISYYTNTTNATEATGSSGALQIKGGASIAKDLHVGGNIYASNIYGTSYQIITVKDPLLYLDAANTYPYNYDIGFYSNFVGPNPIDDTGNVYQHTGVVRDDTDNTWKFFSNVRTEPSGASITFDVNTIYDPVKAGNLVLTYTQAATSTTTGALQVAGGAGIVGTLVAGQINSTGNVLGQAGTFNALTVNGNESVTGYLNVTGNVMTASLSTGQINTTGNVLATAGIFNALTVNGNESVTGYLNVTGNVMASAGTLSGLTVNGATTQAGTLTVSSGFINSSGNVLATAGTFNGLTVNGNESVTGYLNVTGNVMAAVVTASQFNTPGNIISTGAIHNSLTVNGNGSVTGYLNVTGNVMAAVVTASQFNTPGNIISTGAVHNALTVNGNESVTGYLNVTGNVLATRVDTTVLGATGVIWANSTTDTTSTTTGAIVIPTGGLSVGGNAYIRHNLYVGAQSPAIGANLSGLVITAIEADPSYVQIAEQNLDNRGSTDYAAYASDSLGGVAGWADMGFTGNAFSDPTYTITKPHDGYLFVRPNVTFGGNLVLATSETGVYNDVIIGVGSFQSTAEVMRFHGNIGTTGNAWLKYTTVSTTPNTGALRVDGGAGIGGNIRVGGGAVINNSQTADPFQVKGVATTSLIYADAAYGAVILGGSNVSTPIGSTVKINGTDSLLLPIGTTGQRPGATGNVDYAGMIRFNTTINNMEFYDGTVWQTAGSVFTIISDRQFAGNVGGAYGNVDGTNTTFTIQANSTTSATLVSINGVMQFPVLAYEVSNSTLTFTEPPAPTDVIDVRVLATTSTIGALGSGSGLNQVIAANDGVQIWTGTTATLERILVNQAGDVNLLDNNKITYTQGAVNIAANNTPYVIATYSQTAYTTAKFLVSAKKGATNFQSMEALVTTDQNGNAYMTTYAVVSNGTDMGGLTANVIGGNVRVYWTTTTNVINANIKAMGTYIV